MKSKKIIVVSYGDDGHKNHFLTVAEKAGVETLLFDAGGYPHNNEEISIEYIGTNPSLSLAISGHEIHASEISGVWWRRPRGKKNQSTKPVDKYTHLEGETVVRSLSEFLPSVNWVSNPEATRTACRKPVQLMVAKQTGFKIPETCISNSPSVVENFIQTLGRKKLIMKPVGTSFIELSTASQSSEDNQNKVVFTQVIEPKLILDNLSMVKNCPVIFQEAVEKDSDLRITVVGEYVFCAEITLEGCTNPNNVDWRNHDGARIYRRFELPNDIKELCIRFTHLMGLRFGCIDMAYSKKNGFTFFEINPQGQWLPSELDLGYQISAALLETLTQVR